MSREKETPVLLGPLSDRLQSQTYLLGESFTVADVALGSMLAYIPLMLKLDLTPYPGVVAYIQRMTERPAYQKVMGGRGT